MTALTVVIAALGARAQNNLAQVYDDSGNDNYSADQYYNNTKIDRYLDIDVWTNHPDGEFYIGDKVTVNFRTNRDAFVAIYTVDSKGRVNLLYPTAEGGDNYVKGGVTYRIPGNGDDFDLMVTGPKGTENIQAIASRERFAVPDWYPNSGVVLDRDDRFDFMDYVNGRFFGGYDGQRFAFDRSAIYVDKWEDDYYRPVYYPDYPAWTVTGNIYVDYPWGGTVYVNGVYWGIAPLYIPRIYVGWHTITVYDHFGYCWEHDVHITRYNTVVLNDHVIHTSPSVRSKYKEVREVGYRNPVKNGYPGYKSSDVFRIMPKGKTSTQTPGTITTDLLPKKHVRGTTEVIRTDRGYETAGSTLSDSKRDRSTYRVSEGTTNRGSVEGRRSTVERKAGGVTYERGNKTVERRSTTTSKRAVESSHERKSNPSVERSKSSGASKSSGRSSSTVKRSGSSSKSSGSESRGGKSSSGGKSTSGGGKKSGGRH
jgi:hypothetical protein